MDRQMIRPRPIQQEHPTLEEIAEWVKTTCLIFGASVGTAYKVAGIFTEGLQKEWEKNDRKGQS